MACPNCRADVPAGASFCQGCGTKLAAPACPACAQPTTPGSVFCLRCGTRLATPPAAAPVHPAAPPAPAPPPAAQAKPRGFGTLLLILAVLVVLAGGAVCAVTRLLGDGAGSGAAPGTRPGKLDPTTPPVTFSQPSVSPLSSAPLGQNLYTFRIVNVSHCELSAVVFAAVLFDVNGERLPEGPVEVGLAPDAGSIRPGDTYECRFTTGRPEARRAVAVLKEVVYVFVPEGANMDMYRVPMKWTNASFAAELESAKPR